MALEDELEDELRAEAIRLGHPVSITKKMPDGKIVYGAISPNGVIKGKLYRAGQNPEDGPTGDYSNIPFSQHDI